MALRRDPHREAGRVRVGREGRRPPSALTAEASARPRGALELDIPSELPQTEVGGAFVLPCQPLTGYRITPEKA